MLDVLNNLVNRHDLYDLPSHWRRIGAVLYSRLGGGRRAHIRAAWSHTETPPSNWWDIPAVRARWNLLSTGDATVDFREMVCRKWLSDRTNLHALSLGCGTGQNERAWARLGKFQRIDAYDISPGRIAAAKAGPFPEGTAGIIDFAVGDILRLEVKPDSYDMVIVEQSLHHFAPMREVMRRIATALKTDGIFVMNEFVGPSRFQWSKGQLDASNGMLRLLPARLKTLWGQTRCKQTVIRPSRLRMIVGDPSEAVESDQILPLLHEHFEAIEQSGYGGTLLHPLLHGIAHNFRDTDNEAIQWLDLMFKLEDLLIDQGTLTSDFVTAVGRKKLCAKAASQPAP
jgi:SAM-dependent methyltransferase